MPEQLVHFGEQFLPTLPPGAEMLDLGCGPGRDMAWLENRELRVVGADLSWGMLAQARTRAAGPLVQADMHALPFATGHFAAVWCMAALLHLPKAAAPRALAEMRRVLRPAGWLFLSIQEGSGEGWEQVARFGPVERFFARYSPLEAQALVQASGFAVIAWGQNTTPQRHWMQFLCRVEKG